MRRGFYISYQSLTHVISRFTQRPDFSRKLAKTVRVVGHGGDDRHMEHREASQLIRNRRGDTVYTVKSLQERYGVSEGTVLGWIKSGQLKAMNMGRTPGGKKPRWRVTQEWLDAFEQARTATADAPRTRRPKPANVVEFYT